MTNWCSAALLYLPGFLGLQDRVQSAKRSKPTEEYQQVKTYYVKGIVAVPSQNPSLFKRCIISMQLWVFTTCLYCRILRILLIKCSETVLRY